MIREAWTWLKHLAMGTDPQRPLPDWVPPEKPVPTAPTRTLKPELFDDDNIHWPGEIKLGKGRSALRRRATATILSMKKPKKKS